MATFTELWMDADRQARLREAMEAVTAEDGEVMEIGCWEGLSTSIIANYFNPITVYCVDHWLGDLTDPRSPVTALARQRDVYSTFCANMDELTQGNYDVLRADWRQAVKHWEKPLRFIFIDAQHTYDEVYDQIEWAKKWIVRGGVIAGDDANFPDVSRAIYDSLGKRVQCNTEPGDAVWWDVYE
jgi:predicted O-methyltransferase YrrM